MKKENNFDIFTPKQIADILQLNIITIYSYIKTKKLSAIKLGKSYRITSDDLNKFLAKNKTN